MSLKLEAFDVTLPSGRAVTMRYPDLWEIALDDATPEAIVGIAEGLAIKNWSVTGLATKAEIAAADEKVKAIYDGDTGAQFVQVIVEHSMVHPRVTTSLEQVRKLKADGVDVLHMGQMEPADIMAAYHTAMKVDPATIVVDEPAEGVPV